MMNETPLSPGPDRYLQDYGNRQEGELDDARSKPNREHLLEEIVSFAIGGGVERGRELDRNGRVREGQFMRLKEFVF
jgi:hypothetical protein